MQANLQFPLLDRLIGSPWRKRRKHVYPVPELGGPSKEKIRQYMASRQTENAPPPSQNEIRRRLGWNFATATRNDLPGSSLASFGAKRLLDSSSEFTANKAAVGSHTCQDGTSNASGNPGSAARARASVCAWIARACTIRVGRTD